MSDDVVEISPGRVDRDLLLQACELLCQVWPKPGRTPASRLAETLAEYEAFAGRTEHRPRSFVVVEAGRVIAHSAIVPREIDAAGRRMMNAGLARVCTAPDARGRGLGEKMVLAAWTPVDRGEFALSLFQTTGAVKPFYDRLGAVEIRNRIVNSEGGDPGANPFWDDVIMRYQASGDWPEGTIDLRGPGY